MALESIPVKRTTPSGQNGARQPPTAAAAADKGDWGDVGISMGRGRKPAADATAEESQEPCGEEGVEKTH